MKQYIEYLKKCHLWLKRLSQEKDVNLIWLYFNYLGGGIRHGCLIRQYVIGEFWKLSNQERNKRLTYPRMVSLFKKYNNPDYVHYLNSKLDFNKHFSSFVKREWIYSAEITKKEFIDFLKKHKTVIIKPINGVEGEGIRKYTISDNTDFEGLYIELKNEDVMIEEIIVQHPRMVFGNTSVNTIRTHTVLDNHGKAHVVKAILRAGVGDSVVDNYCQGGAIYEVDLKTGLVCTYGQSKQNAQSYIHPGTDIVMLGYQIPNWDKVIDISKKAAEHLQQIRIIGWDVAISADEVEMIEGNHNPDYELLEFLGSTGYNEIIKNTLKL